MATSQIQNRRNALLARCTLLAQRIDNLPVDTRAELRYQHRNATTLVELIDAHLVTELSMDGKRYLTHLETRLAEIDAHASALTGIRNAYGW